MRSKSFLKLCVILFLTLMSAKAQASFICPAPCNAPPQDFLYIPPSGYLPFIIPIQDSTFISGGDITEQSLSALGFNPITLFSGTLNFSNGLTVNNDIDLRDDGPHIIKVANGTVILNGDFYTSDVASFSNGFTLSKTGQGLLIYNGGTLTAFVDVLEGNFQIGDAASDFADLGGVVTVHPGATLSGHGTIGGYIPFRGMGGVFNNGIVAPGGSIGTLTVSGDYIQTSQGILSIEISPIANSVLNVTQDATISGTLQLVFQNDVISPRSITFLNAASIDGSFSNLSYVAPTGYNVLLTPSYTSTTASVSFTFLPQNAAIYSSATTVQIDNTHRVTDSIFEHFDTLDDFNSGTNQATQIAGRHKVFATDAGSAAPSIDNLVNSIPKTNPDNVLWVKTFGDLNAISSDGAASGFDSETGGLLMGLDHKADKNLILGMAVGYDHSNVDDKNGLSSTATLDTARFLFYAAKPMKDITLGATLGYAHSWVDTSRLVSAAIGNARAAYSQDVVSVGFQGSLKRNLGRFNLTPKVGVDVAHIFTSGFNETGAGAFNLSIQDKQNDSVQPFVGLAASTQYSLENGLNITPTAHIKYAREIMGGNHASTASLGGTSFSTGGVKPSKDILTVGIGCTAQLDNRADIYGGYTAKLPIGNRFEQTFSLGVTFSF